MNITPFDALWTFPGIILAAFIIAWAAETTQFLVSQGMALAILAWLQTLPEFFVEAVIAWEAGRDPEKIHLITANFTGSIRLLIGVGWPLVYFVNFFSKGWQTNGFKHKIHLEGEHSVEVIFLLMGCLFWLLVFFSKKLDVFLGLIFIFFYIIYLLLLSKLPPEENAEEVARFIMKVLERGRKTASVFALLMFLTGGFLLLFLAEPFLHSMLAVALFFGMKEFYFVQWVAPFLSEFPEKVSAFNWARKNTLASAGILNLVSSTINQASLLLGIIPFIYSVSKGSISAIIFDDAQLFEIELTLSQILVGSLILIDMNFSFFDAFLMFSLWFIQFISPQLRVYVLFAFSGWAFIKTLHLIRTNFPALRKIKDVLKEYVFRREKSGI